MRTFTNKFLVVLAVLATALTVMTPAASASSRAGEAEKFQAANQAEHEICILEGANICPPEPFIHVVVCITTGMVAGTECPHVNEAQTRATTKFAADTGQSAQGGECSGVAECNDFIAECIAGGGEFVEEHHNPQGQPNLGHCDG